MNKDRLMLCVRALEETPNPERFTMRAYVHLDPHAYENTDLGHAVPEYEESWCGTPACVIGQLAARTDLQSFLRIDKTWNCIRYTEPDVDGYYNQCHWSDAEVMDWFDLDKDAMRDIFSERGCNNAKTAAEAAAFIKSFIANA